MFVCEHDNRTIPSCDTMTTYVCVFCVCDRFRSGPLWEARSLPLDPRQMEEGPREVLAEAMHGQPPQPSGKLQRYFVVRYESLVKDASKVAMEVLRWAKDVVVPDGLAQTPGRLLARAEVSQGVDSCQLPKCIVVSLFFCLR